MLNVASSISLACGRFSLDERRSAVR
jgi:hypothetical protein